MLHVRSITLFLALITGCFPAFGRDHSIFVAVDGQSGPWNYESVGLNSNYQYGIGDQQPPTVISSALGFTFTPGSVFILTYRSGLVSPGPGAYPYFDANGDPAFIFNNSPGSSGKYAPSFYMDPRTYPIYLTELVGTFTNRHGEIKGMPFAVGDGPTRVRVPFGAAALQLGVNDDIYSDNAGSFLVQVRGQVAAEAEAE